MQKSWKSMVRLARRAALQVLFHLYTGPSSWARVWTQGLHTAHLGHLSTVKSQPRLISEPKGRQQPALGEDRFRDSQFYYLTLTVKEVHRSHRNKTVGFRQEVYHVQSMLPAPPVLSQSGEVAAHSFSAPFIPTQFKTVREWELETNPYYICRIQDAMTEFCPRFQWSYFCFVDAFYKHTHINRHTAFYTQTDTHTQNARHRYLLCS